MTGFQTPYQLRIAPLLIIKNFTILKLRKVHVIVKVCRFYGSLFALHKDSNEKADNAQKTTIFTFKKGDIVVWKITLISLHSVFLGFAFFDKWAHNAELRIIFALCLQIVAHLNLEKTSKSENWTHQKRRLLQHFYLVIEDAEIE